MPRSLRSPTQRCWPSQQTGSIHGYHVGVAAELASVLSGGISGFILDGTISSLRQYDFTFLQSNPLRSIFVSDDVTMDVDGYGARIGGVFHFYRGFEGGLSFTTPIVVKMRGTALTEVTDVIDNGVDRFLQSFVPVEVEYILPYRVDAGVAYTWRWITFAADLGYSDWTTAAVDGRRLRNRQLDTLFREVIDGRLGTEITLPWWPVRVRGGYASIPYPLKYLPTDRIELQEMEKINTVTERHQWTVGAGGLIGRVLTLDAGFTITRGERSVENLSQRQYTQRFLFSASYRF
jgi:hypothetical protein